MAELWLFHHALGLTEGVRSFAETVRAQGHQVTTPDLFEGATFATVDDGVAHASEIGFETIADRGMAAAAAMSPGAVVAGFSLGVLPAQKIAQTRHGVAGALLFHSAVPADVFGDGWPEGVPLEIHLTADDELGAEDREAAAGLSELPECEVFTSPGSGHLIAEQGHTDFDQVAAATLMERTLAFLDRVAS